MKYSHGFILNDSCLSLRYRGGTDLFAGSHVFGIIVKELVPWPGHYLDERQSVDTIGIGVDTAVYLLACQGFFYDKSVTFLECRIDGRC